jgi:hypothetical protein
MAAECSLLTLHALPACRATTSSLLTAACWSWTDCMRGGVGTAAAAGVKKLTTETGAGQWGSALAFATCLLDMECEVSWGAGGGGERRMQHTLSSACPAPLLVAGVACWWLLSGLGFVGCSCSNIVLVGDTDTQGACLLPVCCPVLSCRCGRFVPAMMPSPTGRP